MTVTDPFALVQSRLEHRSLRTYRDDPVGFAHDILEGCELTPYQCEVLSALPERRRVSVRGPHGLGKTRMAAVATLWMALTREAMKIDWKVVTTAGVGRQLEHYLWPEIHLVAGMVDWDKAGRKPFTRDELLRLNLKLKHGAAFAVSSDDPRMIEGAHAKSILYIFDESKSILAGTFDAAEGAFSQSGTSGREALGFASSTPGEPAGRFYDIQARRPGFEDWWSRHVKLKEVINADMIDADWAEQRRLQWTEQSAVYQNRVLGEFATQDDGIIPLSWVEAAIDRWKDWKDSEETRSEPLGPVVTHVGVDVGYTGEDKSCLALRADNVITELRYFSGQDPMGIAGQVMLVRGSHPLCMPVIDTDGVGAGVTARLRELGVNVNAFRASATSHLRDRSGELGMLNTRAAAWWALRELLDPANGPDIALPPDDLLIGDLTSPRYEVRSQGKIQVEGKPEIRKRLGRSTDAGDAVAMAFYSVPIRRGARLRFHG